MGWSNAQDFITFYLTTNNLKSINAFTGFRKTYNNYLQTTGKWSPQGVNNNLLNMMYDGWIYVKGPEPSGLMTNAFANADTQAA